MSGGLSGVPTQRLHLTARRSSVSWTAGGRSRSESPTHLPMRVDPFVSLDLRWTIVIALYGHWVAQSVQPIQVLASMSTWPSEKRPIEPVGHPVRHSGSLQWKQTEGASRL